MECRPGYFLEEIYLPVRGPLATFEPEDSRTKVVHYARTLPNALSRLVECTIGSKAFDGDRPLLVLGDLPLRIRSRQSVFVQQRFLLDDDDSSGPLFALKIAVFRRVFAANLKYASSIIVQTEPMKSALLARYPRLTARVHVIGQPAPRWLLESGLRRTARKTAARGQAALFYPADTYPHKNHRLLAGISAEDAKTWGISKLTFTIPAADNPNPAVSWIFCAGLLSTADVLRAYAEADAMLFLSTKESYGVPLIEAMAVGLPIVCPDLPYARNLCGDVAIYFDPGSAESLRGAIAQLNARLDEGWWPDWSARLSRIPPSWDAVAEAMLATLFD